MTRQQVLSLLDYPDATYVEIGSIVGCSRQRVQQIAKSAGLTRKSRPKGECLSRRNKIRWRREKAKAALLP